MKVGANGEITYEAPDGTPYHNKEAFIGYLEASKILNGYDEITGFGHEDLELSHPTDIVIRKSDYTCSRTLMINADKAARDLDLDLVEDLKNGKTMEVTIKLT